MQKLHVSKASERLNWGWIPYIMRPVKRQKFALTSDQLELLLAFEGAKGLGHLAEIMARDPSVVSRNLQKIAECYPVLEKVRGRWELTPLGTQINVQTRTYLDRHTKLLSNASLRKKPNTLPFDNSALVIVNAQNGLLDATQEGRNNSEAEANVVRVLGYWRSQGRRVVHVRHVSDNPDSAFFRNSTGCEILDALKPRKDEVVVDKGRPSAFAGTDLESHLGECSAVVLVGFTANECIDATARDAAAMDFTTFVVSDAVGTFDLREPSGKLIRAERIHRLTMANINAFYAKVISISEALS